MFFLVAIDYPRPQFATVAQPVEADSTEADMDLVPTTEQNPSAYNKSACNDLSHT